MLEFIVHHTKLLGFFQLWRDDKFSFVCRSQNKCPKPLIFIHLQGLKKPSVKMKLNSPHSHQHDESMHDRTGSSAENDALDKALIEVAAAKIAGGRGAARTEAGTDTEQMEQQNPHERGWRPEKINAKTGQESPPNTRSPRPRSPVQRTPRTPPEQRTPRSQDGLQGNRHWAPR